MKIIGKILTAFTFAVVSTSAAADPVAIYEIPAGEHMDSSVFVDMERARLTFGDYGRINLSYRLPKVIAGPDAPRFDLDGLMTGEAPWTLRGHGATAVCEETDGAWQCDMYYDLDPESGLFEIDIEAAAAVVDAQEDVTPERAIQLKNASVSLMHEAIGVIRFRAD